MVLVPAPLPCSVPRRELPGSLLLLRVGSGERDGASQSVWDSRGSWRAGRHLVTEPPERPREGSEQPLSPGWSSGDGPQWPHVFLYLGRGRVRGVPAGDRAPPVPSTHCCDRLRSGQAPTNASCFSSSAMRSPMYPEESSKATMLGTGQRHPGSSGWRQGQEQLPWARPGHGCPREPGPASATLERLSGLPGDGNRGCERVLGTHSSR